MSLIADLHIHSKYSRAVSKQMDLVGISSWASKKGIDLITTSDWTHPLWFREIQTNLQETAPGIYTLKKQPQKKPVRFILTTEISSIYSQGGKTRRVHNVVFAPSLEIAAKINKALASQGVNLMSDGRPITGISSRNLLELILSIDENCMLVPAHIWTPWFSLFGSKSGFDSIVECYGDTLARSIYAVETGLSSDPIMNWQIKELEGRSILSSSDAHSGPKLGREATVFVPFSTMEEVNGYSYQDITDAIKQKQNRKLKIGYTIEFFPEEGKYHWSGHRNCGIRYSPDQEKKLGKICPKCHQPLTIGVESRVWDLSYKNYGTDDLLLKQNNAGLTFVGEKTKKHIPFVSIVPLMEVLLQLNNNSPTKAARAYEEVITSLGSEFDILLKISYDSIEKQAGLPLRKAVEMIRNRQVQRNPGYDGVFGTILVQNNHDTKQQPQEESRSIKSQPSLF